MNILGYKFEKIQSRPELVSIPRGGDSVDTFSMGAVTELPVIKENRIYEWVDYGDDNLYPEYLKSMYNTSPTHNAIVKTKAQMVVGNGYSIDSEFLNESQKIDALKIIKDVERDKYELMNN